MGLFARSGSQAVSVREIADHAGILSGSLYTHFKSKVEILDYGIRPYTDAVLTGLREVAAQDLPPRAMLQLMVRDAFEKMVGSRDAAAIMYSEWRYLTGLDEFAFLREFGEEVRGTWVNVLRAAVDDGTLTGDAHPDIVFRLLREAMAGAARRYRPGSQQSATVMAEYIDRMIFGGLDAESAVLQVSDSVAS